MDRCVFDQSKVVGKVLGYKNVASKSESQLELSIAQIGPMAVAIDASSPGFQFYRYAKSLKDIPSVLNAKLQS